MTWSQDAWASVADRYATILAHPFVSGLRSGSLPEEVFTRYLLDDAHYLAGYARALASLGSRAPDVAGVGLLAGSAAGAVQAERALHREWLLPRGLDPDAPSAAAATPTCHAYVGWLQAQAVSAPAEVAVASVLPCFRVYAEVGRDLAVGAPEADHPYAAWIATYADDSFDEAVRAVEAYADDLAIGTTSSRREAMDAAYAHATLLELMFWDAAWRGETWPG